MKYHLGILILFTAVRVVADVIDGGVFTEDRAKGEVRDLGGKAGEALPSERFPVTDREINGPVGSSFFVLTKDNKCFYASFKVLGDKKQLVVFRDSRVALENCIYQSMFSAYPSGFSLIEDDGGICKPSYAESIEELRYFQKLKLISNVVSINYCLKNTMSYGLNIEKKKLFKKIAKKEKILPEAIVEAPKVEEAKVAETKAAEPKVAEPKPEEKKEPVIQVKEKVTQIANKSESVKKKNKKKSDNKKAKEKKKPDQNEIITKVEPPQIKTTELKQEESLYTKIKETVQAYTEKIKQRGLAAVKKAEVPAALEEVKKEIPLPEEKPIEPQQQEPKAQEMTVETKKVKQKGPSKNESYYSIQVSAHATHDEAIKAKEAHVKLGHDCFIQEATVNNKQWHRLMIGKFKSKSEADRYKSEKSLSAGLVKKIK